MGYTKHGADEDVVQLGGGGWSPRPDLLSAARRTSRWRAANAGDGDHSHGVGSAPKARSLGIKSRPEIPLLPSQTTVYSSPWHDYLQAIEPEFHVRRRVFSLALIYTLNRVS